MYKLLKATKTCEGCCWLMERDPHPADNCGMCIAHPPTYYSKHHGDAGMYPRRYLNDSALGLACGLYKSFTMEVYDD